MRDRWRHGLSVAGCLLPHAGSRQSHSRSGGRLRRLVVGSRRALRAGIGRRRGGSRLRLGHGGCRRGAGAAGAGSVGAGSAGAGAAAAGAAAGASSLSVAAFAAAVALLAALFIDAPISEIDSPAIFMLAQAATTTRIARMIPIQAQIVRSTASSTTPLPGLLMKRMRANRSRSTASAAVTIAGVSPTSTFMFASRRASQTMIAIASSPARKPIPLQPLVTPIPLISNQLKNETIR